jgi:hypothetical protein
MIESIHRYPRTQHLEVIQARAGVRCVLGGLRLDAYRASVARAEALRTS